MLWSEPRGTNGTVISANSKIGEHTKIRRFVLVDEHKGHSTALPIVTYGGQGTKRKGCHPEDHAMVYTGHSQPPLVHGEAASLMRPPIRCRMDNDKFKLDTASRLNYAKLYTIEHNVKVQFIGSIASSSKNKLVAAYNDIHRPSPGRPYQDSSSHDYTFATGGTVDQQLPYDTFSTVVYSSGIETADAQGSSYWSESPRDQVQYDG